MGQRWAPDGPARGFGGFATPHGRMRAVKNPGFSPQRIGKPASAAAKIPRSRGFTRSKHAQIEGAGRFLASLADEVKRSGSAEAEK